MTRDDIIRMARQAGLDTFYGTNGIEHFAALVAAEKEQQMIRDGWRQCAKGQRTTQFCGLLDAMVKAERERCCAIVYGMAGSDNVVQRTVDKIMERSR